MNSGKLLCLIFEISIFMFDLLAKNYILTEKLVDNKTSGKKVIL